MRKAGQDALAAVYKAQPSAKKAIESAAGYAAFSNFGMKILVAGGGSGKGVAVNNKTKATTYMRMAEVQAGLGIGAKKFQVVWVFETDAALNNFVNSGRVGGQARSAAARPATKVRRIRARSRCRRGSGFTRSRTRAWRSNSPPRAPSTTRTATSTEAIAAARVLLPGRVRIPAGARGCCGGVVGTGRRRVDRGGAGFLSRFLPELSDGRVDNSPHRNPEGESGLRDTSGLLEV